MEEVLFETLPTSFVDMYSEINSQYIDLVAKAVKRDAFSELQQKRAINLQQMGADMKELEKAFETTAKKSKEEIEKLFQDLAQAEYEDVVVKLNVKDANPFEKESNLRALITSISDVTNGSFDNISNSSALGTYFQSTATSPKQFSNLTTAYTKVVDYAITAAASAYADPHYIIRHALSTLAKSGISQVVYGEDEKRIVQSIEVAVRRNVMDGMRRVAQTVQDEAGKKFGANAKELSVHLGCAPDHIHLQGKVFSLDEWDKIYGKGYLSGTVKDINGNTYSIPYRGIGVWNCRHYGFSYLVGTSSTVYDDEQLAALNKRNTDGFVDEEGLLGKEGKQYSIYDMTQVLRSTESNARKIKYAENALKASGDVAGVAAAKKSYESIIKKYEDEVAVMEQFGIRADWDRFTIAKLK